VGAESWLQFQNHFEVLNGDMIWKLLMSVCGLKFLLQTIAIYLQEIIILHLIATLKLLKII
jgi:hypothetical protein